MSGRVRGRVSSRVSGRLPGGLPGRLPGGFPSRFPGGLSGRLLGGVIGGVLGGTLGRSSGGCGRREVGETDGCGVVGDVGRVAVSEHLHVREIGDGHVFTEGVGGVLVEGVPVVHKCFVVGSGAVAVRSRSGTGTRPGAGSIGLGIGLEGGGSFLTLTVAVPDRISIVSCVDDSVAVHGIRRVFLALHEQGILFEHDVVDEDGAVSEGSDGSGRERTIDRIGVGGTRRLFQSEDIDEVGSVFGFLQVNDKVRCFLEDLGAIAEGSDRLGDANVGRLFQATGGRIIIVCKCKRSNNSFVVMGVSNTLLSVVTTTGLLGVHRDWQRRQQREPGHCRE